jgi:hypothetical protein
MNTSNSGIGASLATSAVTGFVAILPESVLGYGEKLISVLVLAMVAEAGRRLVSRLWRNKEDKK